jgi:hypothetical protein
MSFQQFAVTKDNRRLFVTAGGEQSELVRQDAAKGQFLTLFRRRESVGNRVLADGNLDCVGFGRWESLAEQFRW